MKNDKSRLDIYASMKEKTERIMLRIRKSSLRELKEIAQKEERTVASVVRQAIKEHLEKRKELPNIESF